MSELIYQLGIDWKLLLAQGANFLIVLATLTFLVYRPLLKLMEERRKRIELGLAGAEEVEKRLKEVDRIKEEKIKKADQEALEIVSNSEKQGRKKMDEILNQADFKAKEVLAEAKRLAEHQKQAELKKLTEKANLLVKEAIIKTVNLDPKHVDEKLIAQAVEVVKEKYEAHA